MISKPLEGKVCGGTGALRVLLDERRRFQTHETGLCRRFTWTTRGAGIDIWQVWKKDRENLRGMVWFLRENMAKFVVVVDACKTGPFEVRKRKEGCTNGQWFVWGCDSVAQSLNTGDLSSVYAALAAKVSPDACVIL